jgi:hypothetical protein
MEKIHQKSYRQLNELGDRIVDMDGLGWSVLNA